MEKVKNKKVMYIILTIIALAIITLGITLAYWLLTRKQEGMNVVNSSCIDITMENEQDEILLEQAYPISDSDGLKLKPFTFTVSNKCSENLSYNLNLEMFSETTIDSNYIKVAINEVGRETKPKILGTYDNTDSLILDNTIEGRNLISDNIDGNTSKNYELRLWIDGNVTVDNDVTNKSYVSKIVLESILGKMTKIDFAGKTMVVVENGNGLYKVEHNDIEKIDNAWNKAEYRYAGYDPNNYVKFNDELWRIIGLVNVKTDSGVEQRLKIVKPYISGANNFDSFVWDNNYQNDWTKSTLKDMLNGIYYESGTGDCYTYHGLEQCDFTGNEDSKGLNQTARDMIDSDVIWTLGGTSDYTDESNGLVKHWYEYERGTNVYEGNQFEWSKTNDPQNNGVGLPYPSDYGYATGGNERDSCLKKDLYNMDSTDCNDDNWFYDDDFWLLSPYTSDNESVYYLYYDCVENDYTEDNYVVYPTVYLKKNVTITSGIGTKEIPYELVMN